MVRSWRWIALTLGACLLLGCPPKKPSGDAGTDAAPTASAVVDAAPPPPLAANDSDVTHYPDQNADNQDPLTAHMNTNARTEASTTGGKVVALLKAGTEVQKLADRTSFDLVLFTDPSDATRKLEGWAPSSAFAGGVPVHPVVPTVVDAGPSKPTKPLDVKKSGGSCPGGYGSCGAICRLQCRTDTDCEWSSAHCSAGFCLGPGAQPCAH
jgi:hypothetical protein